MAYQTRRQTTQVLDTSMTAAQDPAVATQAVLTRLFTVQELEGRTGTLGLKHMGARGLVHMPQTVRMIPVQVDYKDSGRGNTESGVLLSITDKDGNLIVGDAKVIPFALAGEMLARARHAQTFPFTPNDTYITRTGAPRPRGMTGVLAVQRMLCDINGVQFNLSTLVCGEAVEAGVTVRLFAPEPLKNVFVDGRIPNSLEAQVLAHVFGGHEHVDSKDALDLAMFWITLARSRGVAAVTNGRVPLANLIAKARGDIRYPGNLNMSKNLTDAQIVDLVTDTQAFLALRQANREASVERQAGRIATPVAALDEAPF